MVMMYVQFQLSLRNVEKAAKLEAAGQIGIPFSPYHRVDRRGLILFKGPVGTSAPDGSAIGMADQAIGALSGDELPLD